MEVNSSPINSSQVDNLTKIKDVYDKLSYFDQYGGTFIVFIIITSMLILLISYFHIMINIQPILNDWPNNRCKPTILPIAGLITHPEGMTASEYTSQNFTYCSQNILSNITGSALQPLTFITSYLQSISNEVQTSIQSSRGMFDKIRTSMMSISEEIMGRIMNVTVSLMQIVISFKDLIGKIQGTMTAGLFTALGGYYTLKALMGTIAQFITTILITLAILIACLWSTPFTWGAAAANTVIFTAVAIPMAIVLAFMKNVLKINSNYTIPKVKCFDKDTLLQMNDGTYTKIIDIRVGDILLNNNKVTSKIKVTTVGSSMYSLHTILVSDSHMVKLSDNTWVRVDKHPDAIKCEEYSEPFLYCLNTENKTILINNTLFTDWDEIYGDILDKIITRNTKRQTNTKRNNNKTINKCSDIHKYVNNGVVGTTKVEVAKKGLIDINKIEVNDILVNGEKVYGIVEIDGRTINKQFNYNLGKNNCIKGYLPFSNTYKEEIVNSPSLYHLLTNTGQFNIQDITINDYNYGIDNLL